MVAASDFEAAPAVDSDACHERLVVFHPLAPVDQAEYVLVAEVEDADADEPS